MSASTPGSEPTTSVPDDADAVADLPNLPLIDDALTFDNVEKKPTWRGWIHAGTFPIAIVLGIILVVAADGTAAKICSAVFFASSLLLFGTSALYHRINWSPKVKAIFKRIDHANIFLLIAGTYTPFAVLLLNGGQRVALLLIAWVGALLGVGFRVFWVNAPRWLYVPAYALLGWVAVVYLPALTEAGGLAMVTLIAAGGILYTIGGIVYGTKRPDPYPAWFGFHEVFHTLTLLAYICQYIAVSIAVYTH